VNFRELDSKMPDDLNAESDDRALRRLIRMNKMEEREISKEKEGYRREEARGRIEAARRRALKRKKGKGEEPKRDEWEITEDETHQPQLNNKHDKRSSVSSVMQLLKETKKKKIRVKRSRNRNKDQTNRLAEEEEEIPILVPIEEPMGEMEEGKTKKRRSRSRSNVRNDEIGQGEEEIPILIPIVEPIAEEKETKKEKKRRSHSNKKEEEATEIPTDELMREEEVEPKGNNRKKWRSQVKEVGVTEVPIETFQTEEWSETNGNGSDETETNNHSQTKKISKNRKSLESALSLLESAVEKKRVSFVLSRNLAHEHSDYKHSIKRSPQLPLNVLKNTPKQGVLKQSPLVHSVARLDLTPRKRRRLTIM